MLQNDSCGKGAFYSFFKRNVENALLLLFIFYIFTSSFFIVAEADHDCCGEGCPICHVIHTVQMNIKLMKLVLAKVFFLIILLAYRILKNKILLHTIIVNVSTLISNKVRVNE